jgi:hypothetical protein
MARRAFTRQAVPPFGELVHKINFCVAAATAIANEKLKIKLNFLQKIVVHEFLSIITVKFNIKGNN